MRSVPVTVTEVRRETPTQCTLLLDWRVESVPGQFMMVWIPGVDEVPMGFSHLGERTGITVQRMGEATEAICRLVAGDRVGVRGPLGVGFDITTEGRCLLVGGGNGTAPLVPLAEALVARGCDVHAAVGAKTREELLFIDRLEGVIGRPGFVSDLVDRLMSEMAFDRVLTCGPELMMVKVARSCWHRSIPFEASLERYMKCAIGVCDACAVGPYLVCRDGPVFDGILLKDVEEFGASRRTARAGEPRGHRHRFGPGRRGDPCARVRWSHTGP